MSVQHSIKCPCCGEEFLFNGCISEFVQAHCTMGNTKHIPSPRRSGETFEHIEGKRLLRERLTRDGYLDLETECMRCCRYYYRRIVVTDTVGEEVVNGNCKFDVAIGRNPVLIGFEVRKTHMAREDNRRDVEWYEFNADDIISGRMLRDISMPHSLCRRSDCYRIDELAVRLGYFDGKYLPVSSTVDNGSLWELFLNLKRCIRCEIQCSTSLGSPYCRECYKDVTVEPLGSRCNDQIGENVDLGGVGHITHGSYETEDVYHSDGANSTSHIHPEEDSASVKHIGRYPLQYNDENSLPSLECVDERDKNQHVTPAIEQTKTEDVGFATRLGYYGKGIVMKRIRTLLTLAQCGKCYTIEPRYYLKPINCSLVDEQEITQREGRCAKCDIQHEPVTSSPYCVWCEKEVKESRPVSRMVTIDGGSMIVLQQMIDVIVGARSASVGDEKLCNYCQSPEHTARTKGAKRRRKLWKYDKVYFVLWRGRKAECCYGCLLNMLPVALSDYNL